MEENRAEDRSVDDRFNILLKLDKIEIGTRLILVFFQTVGKKQNSINLFIMAVNGFLKTNLQSSTRKLGSGFM